MPKVLKTGNSLAVTIPKRFVKMVGISPGQDVKIEKRPQKGELLIKFEGVKQLVISDRILNSKLDE
jgi:antitoxin component of MazEF toxin-antitoxin module